MIKNSTSITHKTSSPTKPSKTPHTISPSSSPQISLSQKKKKIFNLPPYSLEATEKKNKKKIIISFEHRNHLLDSLWEGRDRGHLPDPIGRICLCRTVSSRCRSPHLALPSVRGWGAAEADGNLLEEYNWSEMRMRRDLVGWCALKVRAMLSNEKTECFKYLWLVGNRYILAYGSVIVIEVHRVLLFISQMGTLSQWTKLVENFWCIFLVIVYSWLYIVLGWSNKILQWYISNYLKLIYEEILGNTVT